MELIYLWVENYRNIYNTGFNFSPNFHMEFEKQMIKISTKNNKPKIYEGKVNQISAIIGKNGSGKTNILDLLGAKRFDRQSLGSSEDLKYFIVYHLKENKFAIEGSNFDYISINIIQYPNGNGMDNIKEPYGIVVEKRLLCYL